VAAAARRALAAEFRPVRSEASHVDVCLPAGQDTTLSAGNKDLGVFEGKGFANAVFAIWLGPKPPSEDLKKGMLG
jgi:hypothetical protein